jgi:hypothetical protein
VTEKKRGAGGLRGDAGGGGGPAEAEIGEGGAARRSRAAEASGSAGGGGGGGAGFEFPGGTSLLQRASQFSSPTAGGRTSFLRRQLQCRSEFRPRTRSPVK